jgi:transcriptional regulator of arginine metabolism
VKNKTQRLLAIRDILTEKKVSSQEELLRELEELGYNYTQATLSRDLRFLKVSKVPDTEKGYIYRIPGTDEDYTGPHSMDGFPLTGFESIEFSNNLAIIKTYPGYASSIASRIDNANMLEILGTIAGDDTILLIPREGITRNDVINALTEIMPEVKDKSF